jgi:hypothetical protein
MKKKLNKENINVVFSKPAKSPRSDLCLLYPRMDDDKGVIYALNLKQCSATYIGETGQWLSVRMKQQQYYNIRRRADDNSGIFRHLRVKHPA